MKTSCDVLVIGAGISGLIAARRLAAQHFDVIVIDKGRGVGGRMATRRHAGGTFDHGAQFITVRSTEFQSLVDEWINAGVATLWARGFADGSTGDGSLLTHSENRRHMPARDGHPRYRGLPGMTAIPKYLATSPSALDIRLGVSARGVSAVKGGVQVEADAGRSYHARAAILTPPIPQTLALLSAGPTPLSKDENHRLSAVEYSPCLVLLAFSGPNVVLPVPGALRKPSDNIEWVADNQQKGISERGPALTFHFSPEFSRTHYDKPDDELLPLMIEEARKVVGTSLESAQVKKWRYSRAVNPITTLAMPVGAHPQVILCGDAFGGNRVEGAARSGMEAASLAASALTGT